MRPRNINLGGLRLNFSQSWNSSNEAIKKVHPVYFEICNEIAKYAVVVDLESLFILVAIGDAK